MLDKLKADFDVILELVNETPAPLQETAFKMILEKWFAANAAPPAPPTKLADPAAKGVAQAGVPDVVKLRLGGSSRNLPTSPVRRGYTSRS